MRVAKLGHSCLLVDPGSFSSIPSYRDRAHGRFEKVGFDHGIAYKKLTSDLTEV